MLPAVCRTAICHDGATARQKWKVWLAVLSNDVTVIPGFVEIGGLAEKLHA
jgi:hypothetical protein